MSYPYNNSLNRPITDKTKIFLPFDSELEKFLNYGTNDLTITNYRTQIDQHRKDIGTGSLQILNGGWVKIENHNINLEDQVVWTLQVSFMINTQQRQTVFSKIYPLDDGFDSVVQLDILPNGRGEFYYSYADYNSFDTVDIGAFMTGEMYKLALVRNGDSLKLFINEVCILQSCGVRDYGDGVIVKNFNGLYDETTAPFYLGSHSHCDADPTDGSTTFAGYIDNFRIDYEAFFSSADIIPSAPLVNSRDVIASTWQEKNSMTINWIPLSDTGVEIIGYYVLLNQTLNTQPSNLFEKINNFTKSITLTNSGVYFFHVVAKNAFYHWGSVAHFEIRYNHKPTAPWGLTVNGNQCMNRPVMIAKQNLNSFSWIQSTDADSNPITYQIQIASSPYFLNDEFGNNSIIYNCESIVETYKNITIQYTGRFYYWRVRSFDGFEYSLWSSNGNITSNTPPSVPTNLIVI